LPPPRTSRGRHHGITLRPRHYALPTAAMPSPHRDMRSRIARILLTRTAFARSDSG
jgi:hypothetical protein